MRPHKQKRQAIENKTLLSSTVTSPSKYPMRSSIFSTSPLNIRSQNSMSNEKFSWTNHMQNHFECDNNVLTDLEFDSYGCVNKPCVINDVSFFQHPCVEVYGAYVKREILVHLDMDSLRLLSTYLVQQVSTGRGYRSFRTFFNTRRCHVSISIFVIFSLVISLKDSFSA